MKEEDYLLEFVKEKLSERVFDKIDIDLLEDHGALDWDTAGEEIEVLNHIVVITKGTVEVEAIDEGESQSYDYPAQPPYYKITRINIDHYDFCDKEYELIYSK